MILYVLITPPLVLFIILNVLWLVRCVARSRKNPKHLIGEDSYQSSVSRTHGDAYIYMCIDYEDANVTQLIENVWKLCDNYVKPYAYLQPQFTEDVKNYHDIHRYSSQQEAIDALKPRVIAMAVIEPNKVFGVMNHVYLGGSFFIKMGRALLGGVGPNLKLQLPPYVREYYTCKFLANYGLTFKNSGKPCKIISNPKDIKRVSYQFDIQQLQSTEPYKCSKSNIVVIHNVLTEVCTHLSKDVVKAYLTFGFEHDEIMHNNVGIMFLDFHKGMTPEQLSAQIAQDKYQVVATNNLMNFIPSGGKHSRHSVDIVFTIAYLKKCQQATNSIKVYFSHVADYPIYLFAFTQDNVCYVTTTVMTEDLNYKQLVDSVQGVEF